MQLRKIEDLDLTDKKVFIRLDLNVPLKDGKITDETRIKAALPTLKYLLTKTNKIAVASHLGRPKGKVVKEMSLEPVGLRLAELLDKEVVFVSDYDKQKASMSLEQLSPNQMILLENLRFFPGETKNESDFAHQLCDGMDFYINDAFGTAHRAHASTVAAAELLSPEKRAAGYLIEKEVTALSHLRDQAKSPFCVVMGGAKVSDKIAVILNLLNHCNDLIIGGAMAYTFLKFKGEAVGSSRVEEDKMDLVESIYRNAEKRKVNIHLPVDHVCADSFDQNAEAKVIDTVSIPAGLMGLDIGPKTIVKYQSVIRSAATVLWNGPMGVFEWQAFSKGTMAIADEISKCSAHTVVGGGDSVAAVNKAGVSEKIDHVSTGGGASLEFLEGKILPGIKVLQS